MTEKQEHGFGAMLKNLFETVDRCFWDYRMVLRLIYIAALIIILYDGPPKSLGLGVMIGKIYVVAMAIIAPLVLVTSFTREAPAFRKKTTVWNEIESFLRLMIILAGILFLAILARGHGLI